MIEYKNTGTGIECITKVTPQLFEVNSQAMVHVVCEKPYIGSKEDLENEICEHLTQLMPSGYEVKTYHVTIYERTGYNSQKKKCIEELTFQVYI